MSLERLKAAFFADNGIRQNIVVTGLSQEIVDQIKAFDDVDVPMDIDGLIGLMRAHGGAIPVLMIVFDILPGRDLIPEQLRNFWLSHSGPAQVSGFFLADDQIDKFTAIVDPYMKRKEGSIRPMIGKIPDPNIIQANIGFYKSNEFFCVLIVGDRALPRTAPAQA